jgi:HPt (histidine-containing phosphotransfer) domain-containing protein
MSETHLLDLSRLRDALGDEPELISEIMAMYADTARGDLSTLEQACRAQLKDQIIRSAHSLKGSSGNVGADRMMAVAASVEHAARAGELERAISLFPTLKETFEQTLLAAAAQGVR